MSSFIFGRDPLESVGGKFAQCSLKIPSFPGPVNVLLISNYSDRSFLHYSSATFQYSVLNTFDNDPDDELTDHLRVGDDFIVTNDSSDDDVELLGVSTSIKKYGEQQDPV